MRSRCALSDKLAVVAAAAMVAAVLTVISTFGGARPAAAATGGSPAYWLIANTGQVYQEGTTNYGDTRNLALNRPMVGGAATTTGLGYWLVASDGGIFSFGDARFHGSTGNLRLRQPIVGMAADPATGGYWMVASDGGVFAFDAGFYGSTGGLRLNKPVVGMAPTPSGHGYWLVASDGGIFSFGDARFYGSTGNLRLRQPVVGMAATPNGGGYWMVASDGGIFAFGNAPFKGSTGNIALRQPIVGMAGTPAGGGYWLVARDGGVFTFGGAPFLGTSGTNGNPPIVAMMSTGNGFTFPPGATGYDVSQYQCPYYQYHVASAPPTHTPVAVVEVNGGHISTAQSTQCFDYEAAWAGPNMSAYIYLNGLPGTAPAESLTGPAGNCAVGNINCEGYNYGFYWAVHWVDYAHANNTHPSLWWLDVENDGTWNLSSGWQRSNANVVAGAVAGLRARGVMPGLYSTHLQWGYITGNYISFPHIPLWVPSGGSTLQAAETVCTNPNPDHAPFAGGTTVLAQWWPNSQYDQDYACR